MKRIVRSDSECFNEITEQKRLSSMQMRGKEVGTFLPGGSTQAPAQRANNG
jgi:hypothetical protein